MNKYNKLKLIGKGSYGTVYKIEKKKNKKVYALKQIKTNKLKNSYEINNLINELKILCFHECKYLLKCKEIFYDNHQINIVTDYAKFSDLSNYIQKTKQKKKFIPEKIIWLIFIQCCYGIEYLHEYNIIHRDLKPANILLNDDSSIIIADFGVSKIIENKINSYTLIGTPYYISPEMYKDNNYDKKIDIWSLGCILYELVTLSVPFEANSIQALKKKILTGYYNNIPTYYSKDIQSMIRFLLDINSYRRPDIKEILSSKIFKKKEQEYSLYNSNYFNPEINHNLYSKYTLPKITSKWNLLINDIDKTNSNKSPKKIINNEVDKFDLDSNKKIITNNENKEIINNDLKSKYDNIDYSNKKINNEISHLKKNLEYNLPHIDNIKYKEYKDKFNLISKNINNLKNYPKLPRIHSNYQYKKNINYYPSYNYYQNNSQYNANYYKNKYNQHYNIINNSKLY